MAKKKTAKKATSSTTAKRKGTQSRSAKKSSAKKKAATSSRSKSKSTSTKTAEIVSPSLPIPSPVESEISTKPLASTPRPPQWLSKKPIACDKWYELFGDLQARRLLATIDLDLFALYCDAWQEFSNAAEACDRNGTFFETDKGYVAIHPAKLIRDKSAETIQRLADRLGIGVNKRRGLKVINPETDNDRDPIANYAKKKPKP